MNISFILYFGLTEFHKELGMDDFPNLKLEKKSKGQRNWADGKMRGRMRWVPRKVNQILCGWWRRLGASWRPRWREAQSAERLLKPVGETSLF